MTIVELGVGMEGDVVGPCLLAWTSNRSAKRGVRRAAFTAEYPGDLEVADEGDRLDVRGRGFEFSVNDGDRVFTACCARGFASDDDVLSALICAGRRAGCSAFDPQGGAFCEAPLEGDVSTFDLWADVSADDDDGA